MPWTCDRCGNELKDDLAACACGRTKEAWTIQAERTRALQITTGRAKLEVLRGISAAPEPLPPPGSAPAPAELVPADVCPALPASVVQLLLQGGQLPAPAHRLVARVWPRKLEPTVTVGVELARGPVQERPFDPAAAEATPEGALDVPFVCVWGAPRLEPGAIPGHEVVDLSEEGEPGFAPAIEVAAVRKRVELPVAAVERARPAVTVLEVEDVCFASGRSILLPGGWSPEDPVAGLSVVAAALDHARREPGLRLLLAGHTDTKGSAASNLALSARRAENVRRYLAGEREAWAAHCQEDYDIADIQTVLRWVAWHHGWDCDPKAVDGQWGERSRLARDAFRERYNAERGGALERGAKQQAADWAAYFDLYEDALAQKLLCDAPRLAGLRAGLRWCEPAALACGEAWPSERPGAGSSKAKDRRVDLLFFAEDQVPALPGDPPGRAIYDAGCERRYLSVADAFTEPPPPWDDGPLGVVCPIARVHEAPAPLG